jgi:hypothetical protein
MKKAFFILMFAVATQAGTIVAPSGLESVEGDTSAIGLFGGSARRTQLIYGSENFSSLPTGGVLISELRFRMDGDYLSGFSGSADLEIHLSTSTQNPEFLNPQFSANIGVDEVTALPRSTISLSSVAKPGGPNAFSVVIPLPTRFHYNPASGYLLMDAFVYSSTDVPNLDWRFSTSDGVSVMVGGLTSSSGGTISHNALVTQFVFEPVPEPSTMALIGTGIFMALRRKKHVNA